MSIFRTVMGSDFERLHPQLQRRFSVGLESGEACLGRGVMDEIWHGPAWVRPFLELGGTRNILAPRRGRDVPFLIENVPYLDGFGRETVSFVRTFSFPARERSSERARGRRSTRAGARAHRFDAQMVLSPGGETIIDFLGSHQHLITELEFTADDQGGLVIRSGEHRVHEGLLDVRVPEFIGGDATVRESYDDAAGCFRIDVRVVNRRFGPLFGYRGAFGATYLPVAELGVRPGLRPVREVALV